MRNPHFRDRVGDVAAPMHGVPKDELMDRVLAYADDMAVNCAPSSIAIMKQQLYADAEMAIVETSAKAEKLMHDSMQRTDFIEGITAFFEKCRPNFPPMPGALAAEK